MLQESFPSFDAAVCSESRVIQKMPSYAEDSSVPRSRRCMVQKPIARYNHVDLKIRGVLLPRYMLISN